MILSPWCSASPPLMVARPSHQGRGTWDGWWGRLRLRSAGRPHAPNGCERTNQALAFGNAFVRSLVTGFLGTHPSAEMPAASGIGEDSGWGWLVEDNAPASESASDKERTISLPVPSHPVPSHRDREIGPGGSGLFARGSVSHPLSLVTKHKKPTPAFENTRERRKSLCGLWVGFACTSQRSAVGRRHPRRSVAQGCSRRTLTDWGIDTDEGRDGVNDRTKAVGDETGCMQQRAAWSDLGTVGSGRAELFEVFRHHSPQQSITHHLAVFGHLTEPGPAPPEPLGDDLFQPRVGDDRIRSAPFPAIHEPLEVVSLP